MTAAQRQRIPYLQMFQERLRQQTSVPPGGNAPQMVRMPPPSPQDAAAAVSRMAGPTERPAFDAAAMQRMQLAGAVDPQRMLSSHRFPFDQQLRPG